MRLREHPELIQVIRDASEAVKLLRAADKRDSAESLNQILESVVAERFLIGVIGATKRGKSTLINGLLGRRNDDCAPIAKYPATNVISVFGHNEASDCKVCFHDREPQMITESEIRLFVTEKHNPQNSKKVRSIEVLAPFPGLEQNVFLVDTPGAGNALEKMHSEVLLGFLPNADAIVFLVTAEEPLTESELNLLRAVQKADAKKLFFAINMVDRVASGHLDPDALAEGIEHNRKALASIGLHPSKFYTISAKNYFEKQCDTGTEELIGDIRHTIATERLTIAVKRLKERTHSVLDVCEKHLHQELQDVAATAEDLGLDLESLKKAKKELQRGRAGREAAFRKAWTQAFQDLENDLVKIRNQLLKEYAELIAVTPTLKLAGLSTTIHAEVAASFGELLAPCIEKCETAIGAAQKQLQDHVYQATIRAAPQLLSRSASISTAKNALNIGMSGLPALLTGTVVASLPGLIGSLIFSTAPTVAAAVWYNPVTWFAFGGTYIINSGVHIMAAGVGTALSFIATPVSIVAFGISAYRVIDAWRGQQVKQKNELATSVREMVEDANQQIRSQIATYRGADVELLHAYQKSLDAEIDAMEDRLEDLIKNRPDEATIRALEERHRNVAKYRSHLLLETRQNEAGHGTSTNTMVDTLLKSR